MKLAPLALFALSAVLSSQTRESFPPAKSLGAGPEDFARLRLPDPRDTPTRSFTATIPLTFERERGQARVARALLPVDGSTEVGLAVIGPDLDAWRVTIEGEGAELEWDALAAGDRPLLGTRVHTAEGRFGPTALPARTLRFERALPGLLSIKIESATDAGEGVLVLANEDGLGLALRRLHHRLVLGEAIGVAASAFDPRAGEERPTPLPGVIERATLTVYAPDGERFELPMLDDGRVGDARPDDGEVSASFVAELPGRYVVQVDASGVTPEGLPFRRTAEEVLPVSASRAEWTGAAAVGRVEGDRLAIELPLTVSGAQRVQAAAEVWGLDANGEPVPVAWIGGIRTADRDGRLDLELDSGWVGRARAFAPLVLRDLRLQDVDTHAVLTGRARVPVAGELPPEWSYPKLALTTKMRSGRRPSGILGYGPVAPVAPIPPLPRGIMLVHGYCSGGVWPTDDFTDYTVFQDFDQNRSNDEFANLLADQAEHYASFGVVAHSQGGLAALHLYAFYWTAMDFAQGPRRIQSVGSPYQGTPLAGNLSLLGQIFGVGCGETADLTYSGAALWLANVPTWARDDVFYYTTSFFDGPFLDYCQFATDFFLSDPEDGVVEVAAGQLPGGNDMGLKTGWCHTTAMADPPQYLDSVRNELMNAAAAR